MKYTLAFSHRYNKLLTACPELKTEPRARARLLQVLEFDIALLTEQMAEYDATFETEDGVSRYALPKKGRILLLILEGVGGLFTTIRKADPAARYEFFRAATGVLFTIEVPPEGMDIPTIEEKLS